MALDPLADLEPVLDLAPVAWVRSALPDFAERIAGSLVPHGYEAYVAIRNTQPTDGGDPDPGTLALDQLAALTPRLAAATATPEHVCFCLWEGFGYLSGAVNPPRLPRVDPRALPRLHLPHRAYYVLRGPVDAAPFVSAYFMAPGLPGRDGPNLWWPDDRAWFVTSEIDLFATYVACTTELGKAIVADEALDASVVAPGAGFHDDGYWVRGR